MARLTSPKIDFACDVFPTFNLSKRCRITASKFLQYYARENSEKFRNALASRSGEYPPSYFRYLPVEELIKCNPSCNYTFRSKVIFNKDKPMIICYQTVRLVGHLYLKDKERFDFAQIFGAPVNELPDEIRKEIGVIPDCIEGSENKLSKLTLRELANYPITDIISKYIRLENPVVIQNQKYTNVYFCVENARVFLPIYENFEVFSNEVRNLNGLVSFNNIVKLPVKNFLINFQKIMQQESMIKISDQFRFDHRHAEYVPFQFLLTSNKIVPTNPRFISSVRQRICNSFENYVLINYNTLKSLAKYFMNPGFATTAQVIRDIGSSIPQLLIFYSSCYNSQMREIIENNRELITRDILQHLSLDFVRLYLGSASYDETVELVNFGNMPVNIRTAQAFGDILISRQYLANPKTGFFDASLTVEEFCIKFSDELMNDPHFYRNISTRNSNLCPIPVEPRFFPIFQITDICAYYKKKSEIPPDIKVKFAIPQDGMSNCQEVNLLKFFNENQ